MPMTYRLRCIIIKFIKILLTFVIKQGKELLDTVVCLLQLVETVWAEDFMSPSAQSVHCCPIQLPGLVHFSQLVPKNLVLELLLKYQVRCNLYITNGRLFT